MEAVNTLSMLNERVAEAEQLLVYVSHPGCSVCHSLKPQVEEMLVDFPDIEAVAVDSDEVPDIAGAYSIFTVPVVLFFIDGKEMLRRARFVPIGELTHQLERLQEMRK
ncbi:MULTISPECIES: thioredoxin family protein [unclassified Exiguobacterium]|uniref:thioredoxin family protein n=1 Tax=unclassified Exiguobacterium TaxID=2644629 RepID=UPI00103CBD6F|nr:MULTISPECIES: thioredoxin family protein [unclassified Exiguobacterium]TCI39191.1 thioredoxin [Exiguobacterium sp. SH4S7]TCI48123.1 thioredoxin [Exiguobacterium sp. SH5S32]TCI55008.1 thioredoxin [Exiguobacterium sp. SH1S4]TCI57295.1 thioredoxin [Exiguobacterium sp. SH1S21]TCI63019.1 thioredoxin [Exiguobacterium sp. SH0S2]